MPSGEVPEVPHPGVSTTQVAATTMSTAASYVPAAPLSVSPVSVATAMPAARAATPMTFCESCPAGEKEREADRQGEKPKARGDQRPLHRYGYHRQVS